ncbi:MAG: tetratricopeptide repeat protein [Candidatus Latescibacteria bacterium]|nr:tetratricopeptide repeat protein [Candidatus Latescibacterota bacterium]MBT4139714.1 tetratricopeptide repeat protein [Candidatus Latescibacterota bacterium]MBT5832935.1 tetratricopeptide repeat protein [Candidatus Latescibacterota bacterium]
MIPGFRLFHFWFMVLLACGSWVDASEGLAGLYNQGNVGYRQGDYAGAIVAYEKVVGQGLQNGEVYYNLGNAYFKNEQLGLAILSYERALKLRPGDEDVLANLNFANAHRVDKETNDTPNFLTRVLSNLYDFWGINALSVFCLICVFGLGGALVCWMFLPTRRFIWVALLVVFGAGLLSNGVVLAMKVHQRGVVTAIVLEGQAIGRSGPGSDFLEVFVLHEGTKVFIERTEGRWFLVRLSNGVGGWIKRDVLEQI